MYQQPAYGQGERIEKADYNYNAQPRGGPPPPPAIRDDGAIRKYLTAHGWPKGIQNAFIHGTVTTPARFYICDDSGSMISGDGHRVVGTQDKAKVISCTRWSELTETLRFHIGAAQAAGAPTEFRLLNGAPPISIGSSTELDAQGLPVLLNMLSGSPNGGTPLVYHVNEVAKQITAIAPQLRAAGKKAALIICSDGEASDGNIVEALRPLHNLPVWVVIRLCTDKDQVVSYWNSVDDQIELNMDVIDDPIGEGHQIHDKNPWLTYGMPLHRLREFGVTVKEIDMIDEAKLTADQMRNFCGFLFGVSPFDLTHPDEDWHKFASAVSILNDGEPLVWSSLTKGPTKWINMKQLTHMYGPKGGRGGGGQSGKSGGTDLGDACCTIA